MPPGAIDERAPGAVIRAEGSANRLQFLLAPEEGLEAGEVVGSGGLAGHSLRSWVVVCGFAFVEREAFEDDCGGLFGRLVVEVDIAGGVVEAGDGRAIKTAEHDHVVLAVLEQRVDSRPFQAAPFLGFVVPAYHDDDELGLFVVELREVDAEVAPTKLGLVKFVVEDRLFGELGGENGGDLGDEVSFFSREGESDAEAFHIKSWPLKFCPAAWPLKSLAWLTWDNISRMERMESGHGDGVVFRSDAASDGDDTFPDRD